MEQIRVLKLNEGPLSPALSPSDGARVSGDARAVPGRKRTFVYVVGVWQRVEKKSRRDKAEWVLVEKRVPQRRGKPLRFIPFVFHGPRHSRPAVDKLPLADIIAVNLDHYRLDAALPRWAVKFIALHGGVFILHA